MTRREAGQKGGGKVSQERGVEFYIEIDRKCGEKVAEERGSEFHREIGRKKVVRAEKESRKGVE